MITRLGDIKLAEHRAVSSLAMRSQAKFAKHPKAFGKPSVQHLGNDLDEWRVGFKLTYLFCEPAEVLTELKQLKDSGNAVPMMFNYLEYKGWVTLNDIEVQFTRAADNGRPLVIQGSLSLIEYTGERIPLASLKPKPAIKKAGQALPVQAFTEVVETQERQKQPLEHLADALIAKHRAMRILRELGIQADPKRIGIAVAVLQAIRSSLNLANATNAPDPIILNAIELTLSGDGFAAQNKLAEANYYFADKAATVAARFAGGI